MSPEAAHSLGREDRSASLNRMTRTMTRVHTPSSALCSEPILFISSPSSLNHPEQELLRNWVSLVHRPVLGARNRAWLVEMFRCLLNDGPRTFPPAGDALPALTVWLTPTSGHLLKRMSSATLPGNSIPLPPTLAVPSPCSIFLHSTNHVEIIFSLAVCLFTAYSFLRMEAPALFLKEVLD